MFACNLAAFLWQAGSDMIKDRPRNAIQPDDPVDGPELHCLLGHTEENKDPNLLQAPFLSRGAIFLWFTNSRPTWVHQTLPVEV